MTIFLKITDFLLLYLLIALWVGDFFSMRMQGKASEAVSKLLRNDAEPLKIAIENPVHISDATQALIDKKLASINRWYWLAKKNVVMLVVLGLQQWLVITAKQNWGLVTIELAMLVICGIILAADLRVNHVRVQLEKALKPYEDRLWFEYQLRS
ncbi:hypothetical protein ACFQ22_10480 [Lentilactobacillus raoultii]|uniref:Uncharacterized protein n=1 Tax=Lentilactobacillus raoultii TaxID=1987503 RepID=A0ABW3PV00_9LACO|nr:hypothetical protein [Lentilactobacillus raoultii]